MRGVRVGRLAVIGWAGALAGCVLVTGGTDGYQYSPPVFDAGGDAFDGDAPSGLTLGCLSALDCAGDAAGQLCCLDVTSATSAATVCQAPPCGGTFSIQLCKSSTECPPVAPDASATGATCIPQSCGFSGATVTLQACGNVLTCTPLP